MSNRLTGGILLTGLAAVIFLYSRELQENRRLTGQLNHFRSEIAQRELRESELLEEIKTRASSDRISAAEKSELMRQRSELGSLRQQSRDLALALEKTRRDLAAATGQSPSTKMLPPDASNLIENSPIPSATLPPREPDPAMLTAAYDHARLNNLPAMVAVLDEHPDYLNQPVGIRGSTLLHTAAYNGHAGIVEELLKRGATVNQRNFTGETALYSAVLRGTPEVVRLLLKAGGDPYVADNNGLTPPKLAQARERTEILAVFRSSGVAE